MKKAITLKWIIRITIIICIHKINPFIKGFFEKYFIKKVSIIILTMHENSLKMYVSVLVVSLQKKNKN